MLRHFTHGVFKTDDERRQHLEQLKSSGVAVDYPAQFALLYDALGILDSKASALLTFNGIAMAGQAIWMEGSATGALHLVLDVAFLLSILSSAFCLLVNWMRWESTDEVAAPERHAVALLELRDKRTRHYRKAWLLACLSVALVLIVTLCHIAQMYERRWQTPTSSSVACDVAIVGDASF